MALSPRPSLTPIAEVTAAGTDAVGKAVPANPTAGAFTRTLPSATSSNLSVRYVNTATTGTNLVTIAAGAGDVILGGTFTIAPSGSQDLYTIKANTWARI